MRRRSKLLNLIDSAFIRMHCFKFETSLSPLIQKGPLRKTKGGQRLASVFHRVSLSSMGLSESVGDPESLRLMARLESESESSTTSILSPYRDSAGSSG